MTCKWHDDQFLTFWLHEAKRGYLEEVLEPHRTKKGERTAGNLAQIELQRKVILMLIHELTRRGYIV